MEVPIPARGPIRQIHDEHDVSIELADPRFPIILIQQRAGAELVAEGRYL